MTSEKVRDGTNGKVPSAALTSAFRRLTRPQPIWLYLYLVIAVTIVPAIAVSIVLLQHNNETQRTVVRTLAEATAGSIAQGIDRELSGMITTLRVLSTTPSLLSGDLEDFHRRAQSALGGTGTYLILLDENLVQLLNTRVPFGEDLGPTSDPASSARALETGSAQVSDVFFGKVASDWVFNTILPIDRPDSPRQVLILTRNAEDLSNALSAQNLLGGWNASILDSQGRVLASSFLSSDIGKPFFLGPLEGRAEAGTAVYVPSQDQSYEMSVGESDLSGWKVVLWAATESVQRPLRTYLRTLVLGGILVIAVGTAAAWFLGRQIAKAVRGLASDARRLGTGKPVRPAHYPIAELETVSAALGAAAEERTRADAEIRLLMREVAHRAKNQLSVVSAIAKQSAQGARSFTSFQDAFQKRLHGLSKSTDLLLAGGAAGVELRSLLVAQIEPFKPDEPDRLELSGPEIRLSSQAAQTIGLAVHELATNASKYGAFSMSSGRIQVSWEIAGEALRLVWREHVPHLRRRTARRGFGTEIIERMLGGSLDAEISRDFHSDGLECTVVIPMERLRA